MFLKNYLVCLFFSLVLFFVFFVDCYTFSSFRVFIFEVGFFNFQWSNTPDILAWGSLAMITPSHAFSMSYFVEMSFPSKYSCLYVGSYTYQKAHNIEVENLNANKSNGWPALAVGFNEVEWVLRPNEIEWSYLTRSKC